MGKRFVLFLVLLVAIIVSILSMRSTGVEPIAMESTPQLMRIARQYKPIIVFDSTESFFPLQFDDLKVVALEYKKKLIRELPITDSLKRYANTLQQPLDLFRTDLKDNMKSDRIVIYYKSLSEDPSKWAVERVHATFPDSIPLYVSITEQEDLIKLTYTLVFEGNQWNNLHRGDGAMYAIYFKEQEGTLQPIKTRAYMHLQYTEKNFSESLVSCTDSTAHPVFFVSPGGHSTYHAPGSYNNVDGLPLLNKNEVLMANVWYSPQQIKLIFKNTLGNNIEKWGYEGAVYWGGSPNDRIFSSKNWLGKIPFIKRIPMGNKSAKMTNDPSLVFDKKKFKGTLKRSVSFEADCD